MSPHLVYVRADASIKIGTGHVERCLTLANALRERGAVVHFICRTHTGHMADRIRREGHGVTLLPLSQEPLADPVVDQQRKYESWLGASWVKDADETVQSILKAAPSWLIVDHYAIDARWERKVKDATGVNIMVIDGLADRTHDCDLLLDQTYSPEGGDRWKYLLPPGCQLFAGPQYALLRPEFIEARRTLRPRDGVIRRIFIAFGGVDELNATSVALEAVVALNRPDIAVDVVVGVANPHRSQLQARCQGLENAKLHVQPPNMAELMAAADLAIGGGGAMMWERCYLGLPALVVSIADNQIQQAAAVHAFGAVVDLGTYQQDISQKIVKVLSELCTNAGQSLAIGAQARQLMQVSPSLSSYGAANIMADRLADGFRH